MIRDQPLIFGITRFVNHEYFFTVYYVITSILNYMAGMYRVNFFLIAEDILTNIVGIESIFW